MNDVLVRRLFRSTMLVQVSTVLVYVIGVVVDGVVTGSCLGVEAMASYGLCSSIIYLFGGLAGIFSVGISIPCGRALGSGDVERANRVFSQSLSFMFLVGVILFLATFFGADAFAAMLGASDELRPEAAGYLRGYSFIAPATFFVSGMLPIMQIDGDRKRVFVTMVVLTCVNVAIDLLVGLVIHGDLFLMALGTSVSSYAGAVVLLLHFRGGRGMFRFRLARFTLPVVRDILVFGLPNALQQGCRGVFIITMNVIILAVSGDYRAIAAYAAINVVSMFCMAVGTGYGQSVSVITGVLSGEKDVESLRNLMKVGLRSTIIANAVLTVVVFVGAPLFMQAFVAKDPVSLDLAIHGFQLYGLCLVPYAVNVELRCYYQAMRMVRLSIPYVVLDNYACPALFAIVLGMLLGLDGVWLSFLAGEMLALAVFFVVALLGKGEGGFLGKLMHLRSDFAADVLSSKAWSCSNEGEVLNASESIRDFCVEQGASSRTAYMLSLATEEACMNVVQHGFVEGRLNSIDVRILRTSEKWILRVRDDCALFDPVRSLERHRSADLTEYLGLRMLVGAADEVNYVSTLKLNNLLVVMKA